MLVDHPEVHQQMWRQRLELEIVALDGQLRALAHGLDQGIEQVALRERRGRAELIGVVGQGHQARTRALVQAFHQCEDLGWQHARHQPVATLFAGLVEGVDRQRDGEAVPGVAGLVQVGRGTVDAAEADGLRERGGGDARRLVTHQLVARELQQLGLTLHFIAVPALECGTADHVRRYLLVVESEDQFVVDQHVLPPRLVLEFLDLPDQPGVVRKKGQLRVPLAMHKRLADEDLARRRRIDTAEIDAPVAVDHQSIERGALERDHLGGLLFPMRLEQLPLQQMGSDTLDPCRLDRRQAAPEQPRGLHQLGRHQPAARLPRQVGTGVAPELDAARTKVPIVVVGLAADVAEQAREQRGMDLLIASRHRVHAPTVLSHHGEQLRVDVAPLAHAARRNEVVAQTLLLLAVRQLVRIVRSAVAAPSFDPLPELQRAAEFAAFVVEGLVLLVGGLRALLRPVTHVLARQRRSDHQHFGQRALLARGDDHAADPRVERQARQFAADGGQFIQIVDRAELTEQRIAVGNRLLRRGIEEREFLDQAKAERLHAQDHAGQRGAQDLGIGEARPACAIGLVIQADADAACDPPAAPGALIGCRLADRFDLQLLDLVAVAVALDAGQPGVDHIADARHRQRGFRDIGGQHDARRTAGLEHAVLLGLRLPSEQRQDLAPASSRIVHKVFAQVIGRLADLALTGQEHQDVATRAAAPQLVDGVSDGDGEIAILALVERPPALFDREQAARDLNHWRRALRVGKVLRKSAGVDGG